MRLRVLQVPDCPNAAVLTMRLTGLLDGRVPVEQLLVHDQHEAATLGMSGSPTLLIDDADPFANPLTDPSQTPSVSCRIYRDETGSLSGSPSLAQLRAALNRIGDDVG